MAVEFVKTVASVYAYSSITLTNNAASVLGNTVAPGNLLVLGIAMDNSTSTTPTVTSITKPAGEAAEWVQLGFVDHTQSANDYALRSEIWGIIPTQEWTADFNLNVVFSQTRRAKVWVLNEYSGATLDVRDIATQGSANDMSFDGTVTCEPGDLLLGFLGHETGTTREISGATGWTLAKREGSTATTEIHMSLATYYRVAESTAETFSASLTGTTTDASFAVLALVPSATTTTSPWSMWDGTTEAPVIVSLWDGTTESPTTISVA